MARPSKNGRLEQRPSFQFYPLDFLASNTVAQMTHEEVGMYIKLLCRAWVGPGLPNDVSRIGRLLGVDAERMAELWAGPLGDCWEEVDGRFVNPRMERERSRKADKSAKAAENGALGGRAKAAKARSAGDNVANARRSPDTRQASASAEASESVAEGLGRVGLGRVGSGSLSESEGEPEREAAPRDPGSRRAKHSACTLEAQLDEFEFGTLRSDVVEAARAWSEYRRTRKPRAPAWGPSQWRPALRDAIRDPGAFIAAVQYSIRQKYQGLIEAKKPGQANGPRRPQSAQELAALADEVTRRNPSLWGEQP